MVNPRRGRRGGGGTVASLRPLHSAPVRSLTAPADTSSLRKSFSALTSWTTWQ